MTDTGPGSTPPSTTQKELMAARRKLRLGIEDEAENAGAAPGPGPAIERKPDPEPEPEPARDPLRIANCSGFFGDRLSAAREMVEGGPIDVLTGDWLAELTMMILAKGKLKDPDLGFAPTFLTQMEQVLGTCLAEGIVVVSNAGGLNPAGCAEALHALATRLGLAPAIAHIEGDDLMPRLGELGAAGIDLRNIDTGESLADLGVEPVTANAYLGGWGIAEALNRGADVVITGRVTDAAVVLGPAASYFDWSRTDWDSRPGTSSSAARSARAATTHSSARCRASSGRASPSPRSTTTARSSSPSTREPEARSREEPSPPSCSTRSRDWGTSTPMSWSRSTRSRSPSRAPTACG
jgi:hypothetical protein